jgi:hypothetical protein
MADDRLPTQRLAEAGRELFGPEWGTRMGEFIGVHERTIRRIRRAAEEGQDYPAAAGALRALRERLAEFLERLKT